MKIHIKLLLFVLAITVFENTFAKKKPNILFVLVDDQAPMDFDFYNKDTRLQSPTISKLAQEGIVIDDARHMGAMLGAVCTASRHMIMTGRTLWHIPSFSKYTNPNNIEHMEKFTIAPIFREAGYTTFRTCKNGNSYALANEQFDINISATKRKGTEEDGSAWHAKQVIDHLNQRIQDKEEKPFFIYFGFSHPHDARNGTPELLAKYGAINHSDQSSLPPANPKHPPLPANYLLEHPWAHAMRIRDEVAVPGVWRNRDEHTVRNEIGRQYACVENIDNQLDKVLKKLEQMGELDNTYIIYTSDHGIAIGKHGLMGKQNLYEHSWRVPFVVKGPGIKAGTRAEGGFYLLDILPTLCELADIKAPETVEGKSFVPVLRGEKERIRETMYGVYAGGSKPGIRTVKKGDWKLIKYDLKDGQVRKTELFNLAKNPHEFIAESKRKDQWENNLAEVPAYADKLKEMEQLLLEEMKKHDDPYRLWDQEQ